MPNKDDFRRALSEEIEAAARAGRPYADINAGELHRLVGGYPGYGHSMPSCCDVLYDEHDHGRADILSSPPKGKGASLTIRYHLPRR
ncbi:HNH endonuclease [Rhizobium leguminosarum bv. viciae]|nr:HNH endonuclease [Rhizobium leguminosarum bv. viciae]